MKDEEKDIETELNRGFLQLLVLVALDRRMYGYQMAKHLEAIGYAVEENTLYPLLRRLEKNGWIEGEWDVGEDRPKKFYSITERGRSVRDGARALRTRQNDILNRIGEGENHAR